VGPCEYPPSPYGFTIHDITPAMSWPSAVTGPDETLPADTAVIRCAEGVNGIFIMVGATYCGTCAERMREINGLKSTWVDYGIKWVFVVSDVTSATQANAYVNSFGITFGWRTHDGDNTAGPNTIIGSGNYAAVPWSGVIRPTTMELACDEPDTAFLDIANIARAMSTNPDAALTSYCSAY